MPFSTQQTNATSALLDRLLRLKNAYYDAVEANDSLKLLGIPPVGDFPPVVNGNGGNALGHLLVRGQLLNASKFVDKLTVWLNTPIDLDDQPGSADKRPLDGLVESLATV